MVRENRKPAEQDATGAGAPQAEAYPAATAGVVESARMALVLTDAKAPGNPIIFVNDSFLALTGHARSEVLGRPVEHLVPPTPDDDFAARLQQGFAADNGVDEEGCLRRRDDTHFWASICISPIRDAAGETVRHSLFVVDLTHHRMEEARLHSVLDEFSHRTQNTFTTVIEIIRQTLRGRTSDELAARLMGRVLTLSRAEHLLRNENSPGVSLVAILDAVLQPPALTQAQAEAFSRHGEDILLPRISAVTLMMALHELVTNATHHGGPSMETGRVDISWTVALPPSGLSMTPPSVDRLQLRWRESGGPPVQPPGKKGFGLRLIESGVTHGLGGTAHLAFEPTGLVCDITMPLRQEGTDQ